MHDILVRAIAKDAAIQITAVSARHMVERARNIHQTTPLASAILGRTLIATAMMGNQLKQENGSITVQIKGNGPAGTVVAVGDSHGNTRGYLQNPSVDLPLRSDGKLNVGTAIGKGYLMVIKDIAMKEPITGTVALVSGEIAEDITQYFAESEQIPSACALGVLVDRDYTIKQAGGYLVQLLPGVLEEDIQKLEQNLATIPSVTTMMEQGMDVQDILHTVLAGFDVELLEEHPISYQCACTQEKVERALISMGAEELHRLASEQENTEITCQFCDKTYNFTAEELQELLRKAQG